MALQVDSNSTMASISADREWLEKSIESEYIRFYPYDGLIHKDCIGHGAFGVVFKATVATSGITVAYKMIKYLEEDDFFKCFVKEVCNCTCYNEIQQSLWTV